MVRSCVLHFTTAREELLLKLRQEQVEPLIQAGELFGILRVAPNVATGDVLAYDGIRESFDSQNAVLDRYIMRSMDFRKWFSSSQSHTLGILDIFPDQAFSPVSVFCGTFVSILRRQPLFLTLSHFCQLHTKDDLGGGQGLIRSLLTQLSPYVSLQGIKRQELLQSCRDLPYLLFLFQQMMTRLSGCAVFCIIDGIHFFDSNPIQTDELNAVLTTLTNLASAPQPASVFKLLVTGNESSWFFRHGLPLPNQMLIEEDFDRSKEDFTEADMTGDIAW